MPTYTFQCPKCEHKFSDIFPMADSNGKKVVCPKCRHRGVKRVFEGGFFIDKKKSQSSCPTGTCPLMK